VKVVNGKPFHFLNICDDIVRVRVQDSRCMGFGSVFRDITIPAGVRLIVVLLVVVWSVVSDMPIYDGF
jgi:hypothetical protein